MIISGGSDTSQVEVIAPSGNVSCSLPPLPTEHGRFHHTQDNSLVCGGYPYFDWPQTCVTLTSSAVVPAKPKLLRSKPPMRMTPSCTAQEVWR